MQIKDYPSITTLSDGDLFLIQTASDGAYKSITAIDMKSYFGGSTGTGTGTGTGGGGGSTGTGSSTDPHYSQVSLLLHFNGDNASHVFTDEKGHTIVAQSSSTILTGVKVFGSGALYLDGSSSLSVAQDASLTFASNDFTWECWILIDPDPATANNMAIMGNAAGGAGGNAGMFLCVNAGKLVLRHWINANNVAVSTVSLIVSTWYHVVATKQGAITNVFVNGIIGTPGTTEATNTDNAFYIGAVPNNSGYATNFNGFVDELRVTNGIARYTANFTPPTQEFPVS